jgi:hypothetical protein
MQSDSNQEQIETETGVCSRYVRWRQPEPSTDATPPTDLSKNEVNFRCACKFILKRKKIFNEGLSTWVAGSRGSCG